MSHERMRKRIQAEVSHSPGKPSARWQRPLVALSAVAAAAILVIAGVNYFPSESEMPAQTNSSQWVIASSDKPSSVVFPDASEITFRPGAQGRILRLEDTDVRLLLEKGNVRLSVTPMKTGNWVVEAGPYTVTVTGTQFEVDWNSEDGEFVLSLHEGEVKVSGPMLEEGKTISANQRLWVNADTERLEIGPLNDNTADATTAFETAVEPTPEGDLSGEAPLPDEPERAPTGESTIDSPRKKQTGATKAPTNEWRAMNREGRFGDVLAAANTRGIQKVLGAGSIGDVMALGDAARLSRDKAIAEEAYRAVRTRFGGTPQASNAAFYLGKMAFNQRRAYRVATRWLELYLAEQSEGSLSREALGMLMTAHRRSGNNAQAKQCAASYLEKYPTGPHAGTAKKMLVE